MKIHADYATMSSGQENLVSSWNRIETHLAELDTLVAGTSDMQADTMSAYVALKSRWTSSAGERQTLLKLLSDSVGNARDRYQQTDAGLAAIFAV